MANSQDLIKSALRLIGVIQPGESLPAAEAVDALVVLNELLEYFRLDPDLAYSIDRTVFTGIVASTNQYSIASGGDIALERPIRIESASWLDNTNSSQPLEIPIHVTTDYTEWQNVAIKAVETTHSWILYYEPEVTTGQIFLYPTPSDATYDLVLYTLNVLGALAALTTTVTFPPGYNRLLRHALAIDLASEYSKPVPPSVVAVYEQTRRAIEAINTRPSHTRFDDGVPGTGSGGWDWRIGENVKR